ncbi:MAG: helix-turn-helix domain-containing protein [Alphaproteobacteria bacterium]|nr:helix-turn-helix domain-containing protein [Alphaproteobacteria bacterium]
MSKDLKTVGELFVAARESQRLSIESIAKDICIRSSYLAAIEAGDHDALPEKTFAVGFVRSYAMALKLDAKSIVSQFKEEIGEDAKPVVMSQETVVAAPARRVPAWLSPFAGVLGVALCWAVFGSSVVPFGASSEAELIDRKLDVAQLQAVQATLPKADVIAEGDDPVAEAPTDAKQVSYLKAAALFSPAAIADAQNENSQSRSDFTLQAQEDAWVRLENSDGTEIWSGVLREGQKYRPHFDGVALLSTSNAGGVSVSFGSEQLAALGSRGQVVENVRLDENRLFSGAVAEAGGATGSR